MTHRRISVPLLVVAIACGAPSGDRRGATETPVYDSAVRSQSTHATLPWPDAIGDFLAVANPSSDAAVLFRRDTARTPNRVRVVGFDSTSTAVTVRDVTPLPCAARARLRMFNAPRGWSLALDEAHAHPVLIDALEDLPVADSQRVVVRIQRILNTLPDSSSAMEFRGLPVVVRDAWLVRLPTGQLVIARAARLRNIEASAHEELRFVVLEGDQATFVARVAGEEESVESWDLLAVLISAGRPVLVIAREGARTLQLELVEQTSRGSWVPLWRSDAMTCEAASENPR
jgi:hypothetical protein